MRPVSIEKEMTDLWQKLHSQMKFVIQKYSDRDFSINLQQELIQKIRFILGKNEKALRRILHIKNTSEIEVQVENDFDSHWLVKVGLNDLRNKIYKFGKNEGVNDA